MTLLQDRATRLTRVPALAPTPPQSIADVRSMPYSSLFMVTIQDIYHYRQFLSSPSPETIDSLVNTLI